MGQENLGKRVLLGDLGEFIVSQFPRGFFDGESILLGVTDHNINMIKTLSFIDDEVLDEVPKNFESTINKESESNDKKFDKKMTFVPETDEVSDVSSIVRKKLNKMRNL